GDGSSWNDGANWDTASAPGASDRACVAAQGGALTITIAGVTAKVASLDVAEGLSLQSGSLEITGPDASTVARLSFTGGTLLGTGAVAVGVACTGSGGEMTGTGTTTVAAAATLTIAAGS